MNEDADARSRLYLVAERQAGYFTAAQALEAGYSYPTQTYHQQRGHWIRDGWGLYRLRLFPRTPHEDLVRLMLWSRNRRGDPQAVVSHESALAAYELSDVLPAKTHLTVPRRFRKDAPEGVILHHGDMPADDARERDGFRVTTPLRTLLDVAASPLSPEHVEAAVREALGQGLVRLAEFAAAAAQAPEEVRARLMRFEA